MRSVFVVLTHMHKCMQSHKVWQANLSLASANTVTPLNVKLRTRATAASKTTAIVDPSLHPKLRIQTLVPVMRLSAGRRRKRFAYLWYLI